MFDRCCVVRSKFVNIFMVFCILSFCQTATAHHVNLAKVAPRAAKRGAAETQEIRNGSKELRLKVFRSGMRQGDH